MWSDRYSFVLSFSRKKYGLCQNIQQQLNLSDFENIYLTISYFLGHEMKDCIGGCQSEQEQPADLTFGGETDFIFVRLNVLKEYLEKELQMINLPFKYEFDRVLDDWVFMCFFVGNDFLPHLPSLEIREGAIDRLVGLYKDCVYKTGVSIIYFVAEVLKNTFYVECNSLLLKWPKIGNFQQRDLRHL